MKNVTITMDPKVARWARVRAAEREQSLARFVGEILREHMEGERAYEQSMRAFIETPPQAGSAGRDLPGRDEIHDRASLRR
ncbi:MAG TPA: hypothetical protein ENK57_04680 [Polyangiaceae bacterium]|nr:hypothetical protein [Polyangiaceae bacterium]